MSGDLEYKLHDMNSLLWAIQRSVDAAYIDSERCSGDDYPFACLAEESLNHLRCLARLADLLCVECLKLENDRNAAPKPAEASAGRCRHA